MDPSAAPVVREVNHTTSDISFKFWRRPSNADFTYFETFKNYVFVYVCVSVCGGTMYTYYAVGYFHL